MFKAGYGGIRPALCLAGGAACIDSSGHGSDSGNKNKDQISYADNKLPERIVGSLLCRSRHAHLLTQIGIFASLFLTAYAFAGLGGYLIPERPKLGFAMATTGLVILLLTIVGIVSCPG